VTSPKVLEVCDLIRQIVLDQMETDSEKRKSLTEILPFVREGKGGA
jgi:ArsR family transcriptional regulator